MPDIEKIVDDVNAKRAALAEMLSFVSVGANYHDLLAHSPAPYLEAYQFFVSRNQENFVLGGLSPEGSLNVYGNEATLTSSMVHYLLEQLSGRPAYFRGEITAMEEIGKQAKLKEPLWVRTVAALKSSVVEFPKPDNRYQFVRATEKDLPAVCEWIEAFNTESESYWSLPTAQLLKEKTYWMLKGRESQFLGGVVQTMGFANRIWFGRMYVPPKYRRQKVGSHILAHFASQMPRDAELHLHVHEEDPGAVAFYKSLGFLPDGRFFYSKIS